MMKITTLEKQMMTLIPKDDFYDGEDLEDLVIWTDYFLDSTWNDTRKRGTGVLSSLVKKKLVNVTKGKDSAISLTPEGIEVLQSLIKEENENNEENKDEVKNMKIEEVNNEEIKEVESVEKESEIEEEMEKSEKTKEKYVFRAYDPEGQMKFESHLLKEVVDFSMKNGIASRGWVNLSIRRNIPVLIGLGYDAEIPEDFTPRVTSKYSGNYWKFTKEEVESVKDNNINEDKSDVDSEK